MSTTRQDVVTAWKHVRSMNLTMDTLLDYLLQLEDVVQTIAMQEGVAIPSDGIGGDGDDTTDYTLWFNNQLV